MSNYKIIGHTVCDAGEATEQRRLVCSLIIQFKLSEAGCFQQPQAACFRRMGHGVTPLKVHTCNCDRDRHVALLMPDKLFFQTRYLAREDVFVDEPDGVQQDTMSYTFSVIIYSSRFSLSCVHEGGFI